MKVTGKVVAAGVLLTTVLTPLCALATSTADDHGWVCHERQTGSGELARVLGADEMMRKLRVVGVRLVDADAAEFGADWGWKILVNNPEGLIAVSVSTDPSGDPKSPVEADTIVINKQTRALTETYATAGQPDQDAFWHGECVPY